VGNLALLPDARVDAEHRPDLLGGVTVLEGRALARQPGDWDDALYRAEADFEEVDFVAVPYCVWDNREPGEMVVWLPECAALAEEPPVPTVASTSRATASHVEGSLGALSDGLEPENSNDRGMPRFTWWDRRGGAEWVQYAFREPARVAGVEVYWFDDRDSGGECRVPKSWHLLYLEPGGETWRPVETRSDYGTTRDTFNRVSFDSVLAAGLRIEVDLLEGKSSGLLEWRVPAK